MAVTERGNGVLIGYFEWIANPLIFYSWISARRKRILSTLLASIAAAGLMLGFLLRKKRDWPGISTDTHRISKDMRPAFGNDRQGKSVERPTWRLHTQSHAHR
jgi:hypothetical protein